MRMNDLFFYCLLKCGMTLKQQNRSWVIFDNETTKYKQNYQVIAHITTCIWTQSLMLYLMLTFTKHTKSHFFQLYQKYKFLCPNILSGYIWVWYGTIQYKKFDFFRYNGRERWKSNILLHLNLLFKNRNQIVFKTFTEVWSDMFLPWKQVKGRGFVQCNATFRSICIITFSWAQSNVIMLELTVREGFMSGIHNCG